MRIVKPGLILLLNLCALIVLAQNPQPQVDSLNQLLQRTSDERTKTRLLLQMSQNVEISQPKKALVYAQQALALAQKIDFDSAEVRALIRIGVNQTRLKDLEAAIKTGEQIVELANKLDMKLEIADGRSIMAVAYAEMGDYDQSSKLNFENLRLYEKLNEKRLVGATLGLIGVDFSCMQNYEKAEEYIRKALQIAIELNNYTEIADQYNNMAIINQIGFHNLDAALQNYRESLKVSSKINDSIAVGINMLNIGSLFMEMNQADSAAIYLKRSLEIFQNKHVPLLEAKSYTLLGKYYLSQGNLDKARQFAENGLEITRSNTVLETTASSLELLHNISLATKDTLAAYKYLREFNIVSDSLRKLQNQKELFRLEYQYSKEKALKEQKIKQLKFYFILTFIILCLIFALIIFSLTYSRQKIKTKNAILEKEKAESDLKHKSKELSINLLALLNKNEMLAQISGKLNELVSPSTQSDLRDSIIKLNRDIKKETNAKLWEEFSLQFKETNSEFYDKLLNLYPDLTQSELKLCAYLRLNMSTKEISELTGQRPETINKSRYRLRKKLKITNSDSNLVSFLSQI